MACLPFICDPKVKRGLMPIGVNILLVSVLLFRLISSGCAVYALVMLHTDAVLQTVHTSFVDTLYVFGRIPLGYMLVVITYSCACAMMPVQVINSVMGLAGVLFTKRSIVYAHICMSFFTIPVMMVYAVLLAGGLRDFYYGIDDKFRNEINTGTHADDIKTKLSCCGFSGEDPCMNFYLYYPYKKIPGCWDLWSSPFHNFLSTMLAFVISMLILEVLNLVVTDYEYRKWRLNEEPERPENTGVLPYISRDAFGDICVSIVLYWRKGALSFVMRSLALCQGCVGVSLVIYGGYSIKEYPSFVSEFSISRLRFNNIYFDDLIRILSSLLVLCGGVSLFTSLQGVSVTCVTSRAAYYVSALVNILGVVMTVTVIIFWAVFYAKVRYGMEQEVEDLFSISLRYDPYLQYALDLVQTLKCCGITGQQDFMNLVPSGTWNRISPHCSNFRPCAPVLQDHFRTFSGVGLSLVSFLLLLQMVSFICANKKMGELSTGTSVSESERTRPTAEHEPIIPAAEHEPTSPAAEHEPISVISEPMQTTPAVRKGVIGILKRRVTQLWADDKANGVGIVLKFVTLLCGLSLVVTGLLLKFDDIFDDIDLHTLFYKLGFNNRRFTYYLVAVAYCMLGLGISEMAIVFYGLLIYCWNSKFLEYILIVLRGSFCAVLIVIIGLSIESKSNIDWTMYDQLITEFKTYQNYYYGNPGITWNLLFFKMECCGVGNYGDFNTITMTNSRQIPIYCCKNVTEWRPDLDSGMESCTDSLVADTFHETGCNDALLDRFGGYMITFFNLLSFLVIFQVFEIVLSARRIRMLKPGDAIDKEIGILMKLVKVKFCKKGPLTFVMQSLALCQGCVGVSLVIYGGYSIKEYPSFVSEFSISRLRFDNIYFDDLIRILASLLVFCGGISLFTSIQSVSATCVTSRAAYYVSALINILGVVMTVTVIIFWAVFYAKVRYDMEQEVEDLFSTSLRYDPYLQYALDLVQTLQCCGITGQQDFMNLVPAGTWNRISPYCSNFRACAPVLQDHFRTFSGVGLALVSVLLLLQVVAFMYANKRIGELTTGTSVAESEPIIPAEEHEPTSPAAEHEPISVISEPMQTTPAVRKGVIGILKRKVTRLWADDKANGVGIVLKFVSLLFGLSLVVTGLLLKFDDIFDDIDLHTLFYKLGFNNRRFTYYLVAVAYCMLGLGISEMAIVFYGLLIYCWNSKFLEYILIVLRGSFCAVLIVIIGLSIESKSNIDWTMYDQLITEFKTYQSYSYENTGLTWKLLYFKMECCGVGNYGDFNSITMTNSRQIPIYCCKNVTEWRPDLDSGMESCTDSLVSGTFHETGCNDALLDRFGGYMITFFNLLSFLVIFQVFDIALSARRIRMLKPGSPIDKEFGILLKSVTGEVCNNKITDSSEELVTREPQSNQQPQTGEDMKRNTILPSLDVDAARGQQPPPNTTTLPSETTTKAESRGRRSKRRRDKKRLAKSTHSVEVHRLESAEQDETFEPVTSQGNDSMKVEQNEDDKVATVRRFARNPSARPPAGSGRKGRRSEKQVTIETEIDNNPAILVRNESETKPQTMNVNASRKDGEKYKNDRPYSNGDPMPTTAQRPNNDLQGSLSTMHAAPNISKNTNVEIVRSAETVHNDNASSGEKARDMETRKREQEDETLLNTAEYNLDHSSTMLDKESDKSDVHQQENSILGDSGVEEKFPNGVTSYTAETSGRIERETVVSDSKKGWTEELRESGVSGKDKDTTENIMKFEKLDKETENKVDFGISDGHIEEAVNSGAVDGSPEKVVITEISDGQTDKEYISGTSDKLTQSEAPGTAGKISDAKEEDETLNNSEKKDNDFPYVYDDDFSDEDEDDNNTGAIDLFTKIAGD
ncbi:uncharacterized protein LOC110464290 [Mizuhopecten yessoensis]|uniref:uncharacterized protein LOC110464290 n=1 Tax=Mizuhopecten yessoensis TaxID=6573 RepID=UPI000B45A4F0|nr:uncharacterized protein LOC110464290 [Mizuhopecten yessoensis]